MGVVVGSIGPAHICGLSVVFFSSKCPPFVSCLSHFTHLQVSLRSFRADTSPGLFTGAFGLDATRHSASGASAAAGAGSSAHGGLPAAPSNPAPAAPAGYGVVGTSLSNSGSLNNSGHGSTHGPMHAPVQNASIYEEDYGHIGSKL